MQVHDPRLVGHVEQALEEAGPPASALVLELTSYDGGSHPRDELEREGVPVAASLVEALDVAGID